MKRALRSIKRALHPLISLRHDSCLTPPPFNLQQHCREHIQKNPMFIVLLEDIHRALTYRSLLNIFRRDLYMRIIFLTAAVLFSATIPRTRSQDPWRIDTGDMTHQSLATWLMTLTAAALFPATPLRTYSQDP